MQIDLTNRVSGIILGKKLVLKGINEIEEELIDRYFEEIGSVEDIAEKDYIAQNLDSYIKHNFDRLENDETKEVVFVRKIGDSVNNFVNRNALLSICSKKYLHRNKQFAVAHSKILRK